ncbi:MAG: hypothetical protein ABSA96_02195 [Candidatus Acidiferrales bacterium]|jgi:hypothetical protein
MRKTYLPKPADTSGTNNLRRVLNAVPLEVHLARSSENFECLQLPEPEHIFGGQRRCVDVKTGICAYGPSWWMSSAGRPRVRIGIVGTAGDIERTLELLKEISQPIEQVSSIDCVLYPSFPGLNSGPPFEADVLSQPDWHRSITPQELRRAAECGDPEARLELLQACFSRKVQALHTLKNGPDVVICALSGNSENTLFSEGANNLSCDLLRKFKFGLKAACMGTLPIEIIWDDRRAPGSGSEDRATRAWNLTATLLHKSGLAAWLPASATRGACYAGISSYGGLDSRNIFAQFVTDGGERFIVKPETQDWNRDGETRRTARLSEDAAATLASQILDVYRQECGGLPRKVVIHKTSHYSVAERKGFERVLASTESYGLVTVTRRGIFCVRPGSQPILRGTAIPFGEKLGLVYTSGYVPFLRSDSGPSVPHPLEVTENWGRLSFQEVAEDLLRLTKMDLNTPVFSTNDPATLAFSNQVGEILSRLGQKIPASHGKYYL